MPSEILPPETEAPMNAVVGHRKVVGFTRYDVAEDGRIISHVKGKPHALTPIRRGKYRGFTLLNDQGQPVAVYQHRFVCEAFHGPCPVGMECRHLDGDRENNAPSNLAWGTRAENHRDKAAHGTSPQGERHPMAKLDAAKVKALRARRQEGISFAALAEEFGVTPMTAHRAVTGKNWSHV